MLALWGNAVPILLSNIDYIALIIMAAAFLLLRFKRIKPIGVIALSGAAGIVIYLAGAKI
jgi:small-conductance mechanosensitive channel